MAFCAPGLGDGPGVPTGSVTCRTSPSRCSEPEPAGSRRRHLGVRSGSTRSTVGPGITTASKSRRPQVRRSRGGCGVVSFAGERGGTATSSSSTIPGACRPGTRTRAVSRSPWRSRRAPTGARRQARRRRSAPNSGATRLHWPVTRHTGSVGCGCGYGFDTSPRPMWAACSGPELQHACLPGRGGAKGGNRTCVEP